MSADTLDALYLYLKAKMVRVVFYYKAGCWLCDAAEEMLNGMRERYGLVIRKVAIDSDPELYELYRFDIPVLEFADGSALHGRIKKKDLIRKFGENEERGPAQSRK